MAVLDGHRIRFGKGLLVILVEPALGRYVTASMCLMPVLVVWVLWRVMLSICSQASLAMNSSMAN